MNWIPSFEIGLWNGWIFLVVYMLIAMGQFVFYPNSKEIIKKLKTHPQMDKKAMIITKINQMIYFTTMLYSIFVPIQLMSAWFWAGIAVFVPAMAVYALANHNYAATPVGDPVVTGAYKISRNPLHFFSIVAWAGVGIMCASWVILVSCVIQMIFTHAMTLYEEKFCLEKYGDSYRKYMETTPRYFLFF